MKLIDISTKTYPNTFTMVDDADFDWLNQWKWGVARGATMVYASRWRRGSDIPGSNTVRMHRLIMNPGEGKIVDHIDYNPLNNQRSNLRVCTHQENCWNKKKWMRNGFSIYKGVRLDRRKRRYGAKICFNSRDIEIGAFYSEIEAAKAYDAAAIKYFGAFANLNFPEDLTTILARHGAGKGEET